MRDIITVQLGSRCNMSCPFCHRENVPDLEISADLLAELKARQDNLIIRFIGGEPTLYMDQIDRIVRACPKAEYKLVTNGTRTAELKDYFIKHNVHVVYSYDGEAGTRGDKLDEDLSALPRFSVSCTVFDANADLAQLYRDFAAKEKLAKRPLSVFTHLAHALHGAQVPLTLEGVKTHLRGVKKALSLYAKQRRLGVINKRYEPLWAFCVNAYKANYQPGETPCYNRHVEKADLSGQRYSCSYTKELPLSKDNWQEEQRAYIEKKHPECLRCALYFMCGGGCPHTSTHALECYFYQSLFSHFLEEVKHDPGLLRI